MLLIYQFIPNYIAGSRSPFHDKANKQTKTEEMKKMSLDTILIISIHGTSDIVIAEKPRRLFFLACSI